MVGAFTPSVPVDHQHIALQAVDGHELPRDMPCFRDTDNLVYGRSEAGGVLFGGYEPNPVSRWLDGVPWDHAGGELAGRRAAVRPALERRGAAVSVPRGRGHGHAGVPPGRDDAGRESAAGPGAGGARVLDGGRAVAERLRRGGRDRKDDRGVDDGRRDRARRARDAGLAVRRRLPAAGPGGRGRARGLPVLLPAAVPGRPRRVGPAKPAERAARTAAGRGGGVRLQERLGAGRPPPPRAAVAPGRCRPARVRLDAAALVRGGGRGAPGVPGAGRDDRHVVVRQDRAGGPRRASAAGAGSATTASTGRPAASSTPSS